MRSINLIKNEINHKTDGPITPFVLISRAIRLASKRVEDNENIANALDELLTEYGWLKDGIIENGS